MSTYDIVIIGSGIGGLVCGNLLAREGYRVGVLEKNKQIGGALQIYVRDRVIFDAGVHYLGGLSPGQNLYQIFKYLGLMDQLKLEKLDENGFDRVLLDDTAGEYPLAQGYDNFIRVLSEKFPGEEKAIRQYCDAIRDTCSRFPLYNLQRGGSYEEKAPVMNISASAYIASLTGNQTLQAVLAGNTILYAGHADETPFYVHALILNSYIESSWKCVHGGSAIAQGLARNIRSLGGEIRTRSKVARIVVQDGQVHHLELDNGEQVVARQYISGLHPAKTLEMTETGAIRNVYRQRISALKNSVSVFIVNIVFKKDVFPYQHHNYYYHRQGYTWTMADYTEANWPLGWALYFSRVGDQDAFADGLTVFTYMRFDEVAKWADTHNTTLLSGDRGAAYDVFKKRKAETLIDSVAKKIPALKGAIQSYYTATPLSFRDYIGTDDGSLYGIAKDWHDPLRTLIAPKTKIPNLYLTGQNLNLHGILGSAISGLLTSSAVLGTDAFIDNIRNA